MVDELLVGVYGVVYECNWEVNDVSVFLNGFVVDIYFGNVVVNEY